MVTCNFISFGFYCGNFIGRFRCKAYKKNIDFAMLGWLDRLGGMVFYIIIYIIIFSVILFFAEKILLLKPNVIEGSVVYKYVSPWGPKVIDNLGKIIPLFKDMFMQLEDFFEVWHKNLLA